MPNKHGDFIWYELMTTDAGGARTFYQDVAGWHIDEGHGDPAYAMISASEGHVGGMLTLNAEMTQHGARPAWVGYIMVDDVDRMVAAVTDRGGTTLMPARDIDSIGLIAMLADPQGAPFYIMKPTPPAGNPDATSTAFAAERPMEGHCAWNELASSDPDAAFHFYSTLFGWVKDGGMDMGPTGRYDFLRHGAMIGGLMPKPDQMPQSGWTFYFRVSGIDAAVERIRAGGGQIVMPPQPVPGGDHAVIGIDPQGAYFALVGSK